MTYWDVPQGRAVLRVSAGAPMPGSKAQGGGVGQRLKTTVLVRNAVYNWVVATQTFEMFIPKIGEDEPILTNMVSNGRFNHQLDNHRLVVVGGREYIFPKLRQGLYLVIFAVSTANWVIILYATYHLLQEPETSVDVRNEIVPTYKGISS